MLDKLNQTKIRILIRLIRISDASSDNRFHIIPKSLTKYIKQPSLIFILSTTEGSNYSPTHLNKFKDSNKLTNKKPKKNYRKVLLINIAFKKNST